MRFYDRRSEDYYNILTFENSNVKSCFSDIRIILRKYYARHLGIEPRTEVLETAMIPLHQ